MSISNLYPTIAPSLSLDFSNVGALDPRITFVRTTTATYYGTETAKAEENLLVQSQTFETTWSTAGAGATVTANTTTAPNGTATADTLTEDSGTSVHLCFQSYGSSIASGVVTLSVFAKLGSGTRFLTIGLSRDTTNTASATFDLSLGTSTQTQANGTYSSSSATITAVAESFFRCTLTVTTDGVTNIRIGLNDTGTPTTANRGFGASYTGDNTSSIILWGAQLEQRSAATNYTPTTTQPITNYIPVLEAAAAGEARFDHNPLTFESLGLLVEEQRTNLLLRSEEFDNAGWTKSNLTVDVAGVTSPSGINLMQKIVENTANDTHHVRQAGSHSIGQTITVSGFVKAGQRTRFMFREVGVGASSFALFDLISGTVIDTNGTAFITNSGNGVYRVSLSYVAVTTAVGYFLMPNNATVVADRIYTGNGFSGLFIWGAQLEAGAFPTSYIQTVAATVTRNADVASMTGTNFSSFYSVDNVGSVYVEANETFVGNNSSPWWLNAGTAARGIAYRRSTTTNTLELNYRQPDGTSRITTVSNAIPAGQYNKVATSFNASASSVSVNGASATTSTSNNLYPLVDQLRIGFSQIAGNVPFVWSGTIKKLSYYPQKLTDAQLQALTT